MCQLAFIKLPDLEGRVGTRKWHYRASCNFWTFSRTFFSANVYVADRKAILLVLAQMTPGKMLMILWMALLLLGGLTQPQPRLLPLSPPTADSVDLRDNELSVSQPSQSILVDVSFGPLSQSPHLFNSDVGEDSMEAVNACDVDI